MSQLNSKTPAWNAYANTLIQRLRRHHGMPLADKMEPREPSELDLLFAEMEGTETEFLSPASSPPSRYVPARQVMTAIRLAATIGSADAELDCRQCGALTVLRDVAVEDVALLKDVLKICFPRDQLHIISPDVAEGAISKSAEDRLYRQITDGIDKIEPVLILLTHGLALPKYLFAVSPRTSSMAPITRDILTAYLQSGHLSDQLNTCRDLRVTLPEDTALAGLGTTDVCAALRAKDLPAALMQLANMTRHDTHIDGPRLEDMTGDSPALMAARRIVDDLRLWKQGKARWNELSRSMLLYGAPGTGKTWLARAMGNSAGIAVVTATFGSWQSAGHLGDMLREMRASFAEARSRAPCIFVIDEIDAVGSRTDDDRHATHYRIQVISCFLAEMDSIFREEGVVVVGTCNNPEQMDPAVLRAGRMDLKIQVPMPDSETILTILRHHLREDLADLDLRNLAPQAVGRSAADLDAAIRAARSDARHSKKLLNVAMLRDHLNIGAAEENAGVYWRVAIHEAGHAVIGAALKLGHISSMQITDVGGSITRDGVRTQSLLIDIEDEIAYAMGGRAAERLVFGEVSSGAGGPKNSDLAKATRYALDIEATYGLGCAGPVWHATPEAVHLANSAVRDRVRIRIERAEKRAGIILEQNRDVLDALARNLLKKRSMRSQEIQHFLQSVIVIGTHPKTEAAVHPAFENHANQA